MSLDKVLHKIQGQIHELAPTLEIFVDDTIQPSVSDCELLQQQLNLLQESIAVYKYDKVNKEISPSFNIHAKVSAQETVPEKPVEKPAQPVPHINHAPEEKINVEAVEKRPVEMQPEQSRPADRPKAETARHHVPLTIGLNDKFRFINMLFSQNAAEYNIAVEQLGNMSSWSDTEVYLNSLKNLYDWNETNDVVKHFYSIAKRRFN